MSKYIYSLLLVLVFIPVAMAQENTRWGVVVTVDQIEGLGHTQDDFASLIPAGWLAPSEGQPRYRFDISPSVEDMELCVFDPGGTAMSRRINIDLTITDLETDHVIDTQSFVGIIPPSCAGATAPAEGTTVSVYHPQLIYTDLLPTLSRIMAGADLPGVPELVRPDTYIASYSPDGLRLATALWSTVQVLDVQTGELILEFTAEGLSGNDRIFSMNYSPDGTRIVTGSRDMVTLWDANTGKKQLEIAATGSGSFTNFSPDSSKVVTTVNYDSTTVWDASTGENLFQFSGGNSAVYSADGLKILTSDYTDGVQVWDAATGAELLRISQDEGTGSTNYQSAYYNPDEDRIITTSQDETIRVWDASTGEQLLKLDAGMNTTKAVYSPDGRFIVSIGHSNIQIWDANSGEKINQLFGPANNVSGISFSPDGTGLVATDTSLWLWNASDLEAAR